MKIISAFRISLLFLLLFITCSATSDAQFPVIRNFGPQNYQGGTQNWELIETDSHYIYSANNNGLLSFNGYEWDLAQVVNYTNVHALKINSSHDRIYVGAFDDIGYFKNERPLNRSRYVSLSDKLPAGCRPFQDVWIIDELPDGRIAFQTNSHIFIYDPKRETFSVIRPEGQITEMAVVGRYLYVATDKRIYTVAGSTVRAVPGSEAVAKNHIVAIFTAVPAQGEKGGGDEKNIVMASRDSGFFIYEKNTFRPYPIPALDSLIKGINIFCAKANDRWLALGTVGHGLIVMERATGRVQQLDRSNGLRNNTVLGILIDSDDNIWAGLDNGISYIIYDSPFRELFTEINSVGTGYASATFGGRLYVGTNQGLYHIPLPGEGDNRTFDPVEVKGVSGQIWGLAVIDGRLICGANAGVYNVAGDTATPVEGIGGAWGFRPYPGRKGTVIASAYDGFYVLRLEGNGYKVANKIEGINEGTSNFEIDGDGSIWYSHWLQGVYHITPDRELAKAVKRTVYNAANQLPGDDNNLVAKIGGKIYLSSVDGFREPKGDGTLSGCGWLDRLFPPGGGAATRLFSDNDGNIWGYRADILKYARKQGGKYSIRKFHYSATVERLQMSLGNISFLRRGEAVLNQDDGFYVVDPATRLPSLRKVEIDYVRTLSPDKEGNSVYLYEAGAPGSLSGGLEIGHNDNSLYIHYSVSEYRDEKAVMFSTRVKGYEDEWTEYSATDYRELTRIPPGRYEMQVRALDTITGDVSETSVSFRIIPAWYQTWWAMLILLLLLAFALYILLEYMRWRVVKRLEKEHEEEDKRREEEEERRRGREERERLALEKETEVEKNLKLSDEIKKKSGELADSDITAQRKNDVLKSVTQQLDEILRGGKNATTQELLSKLRRVAMSIRLHGKEDVKWERMEQNFNIIFDDLLQRLIKKYPNLTKTEIKLCSYLKLNMSTKEIATLLSLSERSVESARYRLRKKLEMEAGQSFIDFFATFEKSEHNPEQNPEQKTDKKQRVNG